MTDTSFALFVLDSESHKGRSFFRLLSQWLGCTVELAGLSTLLAILGRMLGLLCFQMRSETCLNHCRTRIRLALLLLFKAIHTISNSSFSGYDWTIWIYIFIWFQAFSSREQLFEYFAEKRVLLGLFSIRSGTELSLGIYLVGVKGVAW